MKTSTKPLIIALGFIATLFLSSCDTQESEPQLKRVSYQSDATGAERDFFVYLPKGYEEKEDWPVLMFLHGNGERGDAKEELDYVLIHGPLYEAWVQKKDLPFVIIAPQLPIYSMGEVSYIKGRSRDWIPERLEEGTYEYPSHYDGNDPMDGVLADMNLPNGPEGPIDGWFKLEQDLMDILDTVQSHFKTDEKRAYLSGLSYGGYGTWYIGSRHAERFAALNPVVGYGHVDLVAPLAESQKPIWVFAGGRDTAVPVKYFYSSLQKLEELGHKDVRFTIHGDQGHDTWRRIYASEDLYSWFLEHSL